MMDAWELLCGAGLGVGVAAASLDGVRPAGYTRADIKENGECALKNGVAAWRVSVSLSGGESGAIDGEASFLLERGHEPAGNVRVELAFSRWSAENYVLMPAAAYNGNRFRSLPVSYPPFLHAEDGIGPDMPVTITDVPRLSLGEGPSEIHLRSGDMATPAAGVRMAAENRGFLFLFEHVTQFGYTGVRLAESADRSSASLWLEAPAVRQRKYIPNGFVSSDDTAADFAEGDCVTIRFRALLFSCPDVPSLFQTFFGHRKDVCGSFRLAHSLPLSAAYRLIERKYNESQFNEAHGYYMLSPGGQGWTFGDWQAGWCGGGLNSLALLYDGGPLSRERANRTMDAAFGKLQLENGFVLPILSDGKPLGDDFCHQGRTGVLLIRKDADVLAYAARHILLAHSRAENVPEQWLKGLARLADALLRLWERYGQFGQFVDMESEEILIGGSAAGSMATGGLALAWQVLGDEKYLAAAKESALYYYEKYVRIGLLNGGPGEILQCPDSESASNMLESLVILYEMTGSREWLPMALDAAAVCASWCVSYDFAFPAASAFGQLGMRTLGSVYANVQNKHSAPGFCTVSGASLLRLYRATGDRRCLDLLRDTAHNITQYLSRPDRPIPDWDGGFLPAGWMCERVNLCDWEGKDRIGGVFCGSCWCEISCLLTYAEVPGVLFLTDTGEAIAIDHVDVSVCDAGESWKLTLANPTAFDAEVKLLAERRSDWRSPWEQCVGERCRKVSVPARGLAEVFVSKSRHTTYGTLLFT